MEGPSKNPEKRKDAMGVEVDPPTKYDGTPQEYRKEMRRMIEKIQRERKDSPEAPSDDGA